MLFGQCADGLFKCGPSELLVGSAARGADSNRSFEAANQSCSKPVTGVDVDKTRRFSIEVMKSLRHCFVLTPLPQTCIIC